MPRGVLVEGKIR